MKDKAPNPRPRTAKLIEDMLKQRKRMLVLLAELSMRKSDASATHALREFLEVLIDYIAAGHFGLYARISEGTERRQAVVDTAREIHPRIAATTDVAMEFTEKYEKVEGAGAQPALAVDLSKLGEEITTRIELEDKLIMAMLGAGYAIRAVASA